MSPVRAKTVLILRVSSELLAGCILGGCWSGPSRVPRLVIAVDPNSGSKRPRLLILCCVNCPAPPVCASVGRFLISFKLFVMSFISPPIQFASSRAVPISSGVDVPGVPPPVVGSSGGNPPLARGYHPNHREDNRLWWCREYCSRYHHR